MDQSVFYSTKFVAFCKERSTISRYQYLNASSTIIATNKTRKSDFNCRDCILRNTEHRSSCSYAYSPRRMRSYIYLILIPRARTPLEESALFLEVERLGERGVKNGTSRVSQCVTRSLLRANAFDEDREDEDEEDGEEKRTTTTGGHCAVSRLERGRLTSLVRIHARIHASRRAGAGLCAPGNYAHIRMLGTLNPGPASSLSQTTEPVVSPQGVREDLTHSLRASL